MNISTSITREGRRQFLSRLALAGAFFTSAGLLAEELTRTPPQTEGPFYPDRLPLDTDNDLLVVNDSITPALGGITWLSGRVLDLRGEPMRNVLVEIWQCDHNGVYLHSQGGDRGRLDPNFQGFGRFLTGSSGEYLFRTIKPVPYTGRTPHIHFALKTQGRDKWTTQCYVKGETRNEQDGVYRRISNPRERQSVTVPFVPIPGSPTGELAARFDIVPGFTPQLD